MESSRFVRFLKSYARSRMALIRAQAVRGFTPYQFAAQTNKGFTLIEMLVVLAIIVILTTIVLVSQTGFNQSILLSNSAYDLAIALRQAESYGISSRSFLYQNALTTNAGYGIYYTSTLPTGYTLFADIHGGVVSGAPDAKPGNGVYDPSFGETVASYTFTRGVTAYRFCGTLAVSHAVACSDDEGMGSSSLDIVFTRPNTDAIVTAYFSGSPYSLSSATLYLTSPQGGKRCVTVSNVGEISVSSNCP